ADEPREMRHTISITGMAPTMVLIYNYGAGYDYLLTKPIDTWGLTASASIKSGYLWLPLAGNNLLGAGRTLRSDLGVKAWWRVELENSRFDFFLGLSGVYIQEKHILYYQDSSKLPSVEVGRQLFSRILPGFALGIVFRPQKISHWSFGMSFNGLLNNSANMTYLVPNGATLQNTGISLGRGLFWEFLVGYSF
ncbi:MAG TPA: hypothetical protein PLY93_12585, partial [Turneriella sp.]|nr:hypothetical protein [Turneriella sp.]